MKIIKPSYEILTDVKGDEILKRIEAAGRTCYKSEDRITPDSAEKFVKMIAKNGHASVIEHESVSVRVICDRGISHQIVRHRLAAYSQESTRYCNYSKEKKFDGGINVIDMESHFKHPESFDLWMKAMLFAEDIYMQMLDNGEKPEMARNVLPQSLKTEIVITYNLRVWKHFFTERTSNHAHPQIREIIRPLLDEFKSLIPVIFDDINY